ncbi:MAG: hypothetical protein JSR77_13235 [Planctomycetes bacterium]|nr:hypothetical protein [Planctomycetota bacterium]
MNAPHPPESSLFLRLWHTRARWWARRISRARGGMVLDQLCILMVMVLPVWALTPAMLYILMRYFYRISSTVTGPFP